MRAIRDVRVSANSTAIALALWVCLVTTPVNLAQAVGAKSSSTNDPAIEFGKISIFVEVTDKSGHPISGLQAADFKLLDNKRAERILAFSATDAAHPAATPAEVQIIIDAMNSGPVLVARERDGVSSFLKQSAGKLEFATSVWSLENQGLKEIAGPSRDRAALLAALNGSQSPLRVLDQSAGVWGDVERSDQAIRSVKEMIAPDARPKGRKLVLFVSPG